MNATTIKTTELPYDLRRYIKQAQSDAGSANQADHKPTFQSEYDGIASRAVKLYSVGQEFMKRVEAEDKDDLARCNRLFALDHEYGSSDLVEAVILGKRMIVPRYVTLIERMRKLRVAII
jgi:hypothetical protein